MKTQHFVKYLKDGFSPFCHPPPLTTPLSSLTTLSLFIINFEQVYNEIFFSLKYLFHFLHQLLITLSYKNNFMEVQPISKYKSSLLQMFFKIGILKIFTTGKGLCWRTSATLLKRDLKKHLQWLLPKIHKQSNFQQFFSQYCRL